MAHPRLLDREIGDPANLGRPSLDDPDVQQMITAIAPGSRVTDLGGMMSLNVRLHAPGLVLRVHRPFVSRQRLLALQQARRQLGDQGLLVPTPVRWKDAMLFRCGNRWVELEAYLPHQQPTSTLDSYAWMFRAMGDLHNVLARLDLAVPRPLVATYAPPGTLRRWLRVTEKAVQGDPKAVEIAQLARTLVGRLRRQWLPASGLPTQLVHGDVRLGNVCRTAEGGTVYLDFGFFARRPRMHELAYALAFVLLALDAHRAPELFDWACVPRLVAEYEAGANVCLTPLEQRALAPYVASIPLYFAAFAEFTKNPVGGLCSSLPFLQLSKWLLAHPTLLPGAE